MDRAANAVWLSGPDLAARGLDAELVQVGAGDTTRPRIESEDLSSSLVDTSSQSATITVTVRVTDDLSGVITRDGGGFGYMVRFDSPSGHTVSCYLSPSTTTSSGSCWCRTATYRARLAASNGGR